MEQNMMLARKTAVKVVDGGQSCPPPLVPGKSLKAETDLSKQMFGKKVARALVHPISCDAEKKGGPNCPPPP